MPLEVFSNLAQTAVALGGTGAPAAGTVETWTVSSPSLFPAIVTGATQFHVADVSAAYNSEIIRVTAATGGTWTVVRGASGTTPVAHAPGFTVVQVVTAGGLQSFQYKAWQFPAEVYGARGDGKMIADGAMTNGSAVLTSGGLAAPAAPAVSNSGSGGTIAAGTYQVEITYVNPYGETVASASTSTTTTGSTSTITITNPLPSGDAYGWYAYVTQAGGSSYTRQQAAGSPTAMDPAGTSGPTLVLTAPPTNTGAAPPVSNTTASNPFTSADVGKFIMVWFQGGATGTWLQTTIASYQSAGQVTLSANAGSTTSIAGVVWGTDDTAAIQSAVNAATTYALTGGGAMGEVLFRAAIYILASPATLGGATLGNAQIALPFVGQAQRTVQLALTGAGSPEFPDWAQSQPVQSGTILLSTRVDGVVDATYGPPSVIGSPYARAESDSNMHLILDGLSVAVPPHGTTTTPYCGADLFALDNATIGRFSYFPVGVWANVVPGQNSTVWPHVNGGYQSHLPSYTFGLRLPLKGNEGVIEVQSYTCLWAQYGLIGCEHMQVTNLITFYTQGGYVPGLSGHGGAILRWSCQNTPYPIYSPNAAFPTGSQNPSKVFIGNLNLESYTSIVNDPNGHMYGICHFENQEHDPNFYFGNQITNGGQIPGIKLVAMGTKPGPQTAPAIAASTVAVGNYFYRDAVVIVSGGTVTEIDIDGTSTGLTTGMVIVPSGHTITLTYSVAPTWSWFLL